MIKGLNSAYKLYILTLTLMISLSAEGCNKSPTQTSEMTTSDVVKDMTPSKLHDNSDSNMSSLDMSDHILRPRFEPDSEHFFDMPWPSDARLTEKGTPRFSDFPTDHGPFLRVLDELESSVFGYANMPVIYIGFDDAISHITLPTPHESLSSSSPIQLIALGDQCGQRVSIDLSVRVSPDRYIDMESLQAKPTIGSPLLAKQPYALVILKNLGSEHDQQVESPERFQEQWRLAQEGSEEPWPHNLRILQNCLNEADLDSDHIALATVFTPQDPTSTLRAMREVVMDAEQVVTQPPVVFHKDEAWSRKRLEIKTYSGLIPFPIFQTGRPPYQLIGGGIQFDENDQPIIQRWEDVPFAVAARSLPNDDEQVRPVLVFIDGTGWSPWTHLRSRWLSDILDAGFLVFSFMPQFHGERAGVMVSPEVPTFNFLNPESGRTNFQQQAAEISYFLRVIREQMIDHPLLPAFDSQRIVYGGHSQGAVAGSLNAAVESEYAAYVFNGLSAYLTLTILDRKDLLDFELVVRNLLDNEYPLDLFSPALQFMQVGSEAVDPYNFAQYWRGSTSQPQGNHIFLINGHKDETTTPRGMDHLILSAQIPVLNKPGWNIDPQNLGLPDLVSLPLRGNIESFSGDPLTIAAYLDALSGHFTVYRNSTLRQMTIQFWQSALQGEVPSLETSQELMCSDEIDDDQDQKVDCEDQDCQQQEPCVETQCDDGKDGDGDQLVDCADPDCTEKVVCQEQDCDDGLDEDQDGLIDCEDPGCRSKEPCSETRCADNADGDGDQLVDCDDPDCLSKPVCRETSCDDQEDNNRNGLIDCEDPECQHSLACPEVLCDDGLDDDGNGYIDCGDPRCFSSLECPSIQEIICDDEFDNDEDGLVDCDDPDCTLSCPTDLCTDGDLGSKLGIGILQTTLIGRSNLWAPGDCTRLGSGKDTPDVSIYWTAPYDGTFRISTLGSEADTVLTLYPADCDSEREIACHDDLPGVSNSAILLEINAGQSVAIVISAFEEDESGQVVLHILPVE